MVRCRITHRKPIERRTMKRLTSFVPAGTLVLTSILLSPLASGGERLQFSGSHPGVQSIKLTNAQVDYFFIGDLRVENDAGTDVASPTEATFSVVGSPEAFSRPAAFLMRKDAGGVLVMNEKLRSP